MELSSFANYELGEAFFNLVSQMIVKDEIPYSKVGDFDFVSKNWRKLADKEDKTSEEIKKLDDDYKTEIRDLADSCILYMGLKTGNKSYQFSFEDYKKFSGVISVFGVGANLSNSAERIKILQNQFNKIANHGEKEGDNFIDNRDFAALIYALDMKSQHDENEKFTGFTLNGKITPLNYAVACKELKSDEDNFIALKLRHAYKNLFG